MSQRQPSDDALPGPLREYVTQLKTAEPPLPEPVIQRLKMARMSALGRFAARKNQFWWGQDALSWVSVGHPKLLLATSCMLFLVVGLIAFQAQQTDDAMLLGADLPLEAFADNGFAAWQDAEQI